MLLHEIRYRLSAVRMAAAILRASNGSFPSGGGNMTSRSTTPDGNFTLSSAELTNKSTVGLA